MKNKLWVKILYILTLIIQVGIVIGTFVVEYLTNKKAGVMHHVYYRRYQFENGIFSQQYKYSKEYFDYFHSYIFSFSYYGIKK